LSRWRPDPALAGVTRARETRFAVLASARTVLLLRLFCLARTVCSRLKLWFERADTALVFFAGF
jgi:hypothetical protein